MLSRHRKLYAAFLILLIIGAAIAIIPPGFSLAMAQQASPTAPLSSTTIPSTPLPDNSKDLDMTNGIIVGGIFLVLIIIGGTLNSVRYRPKQ